MKKTCRYCKGRGKILTSLPIPMQVICTQCGGTGLIDLPDQVVRKPTSKKQEPKRQAGESS
ncbi:hypothetical protein [Tumebacillus lipolyticus]|uniref:Uncharacterized protein n=1 Tax=Tumebacillus lipolyticus TaxID=1280370 RepID=A0ABW4ZVX8_9BACL